MKKSTFYRIIAVILAVVSLSMSAGIGSYAYHLPTGYTMSSSYKSSKYYTQLAAVKLTGNQRKDIVAIAKSQVGYHEGSAGDYSGSSTSSSGNYTEYNRYAYYLNNAAWCGSFVSWCAAMAGIPTSILPKTAAAKPTYWKMCGTGALEGAVSKTPEDLVTNGGSYLPQAGDLVFFGSKSTGDVLKNSCTHVGLVTEVNLTYTNGKVTAIEVITTEGNYSDKVKQNKYVFDADNRDGHAYRSTYLNTFCVPNYDEGKIEYASIDIGAYGGSALRVGSANTKAVKTLQMGLNLASVMGSSSLPTVKVNGVFDETTKTAVKKYQSANGLDTDGVAGPATWRELRADLLEMSKAEKSDYIVSGGKLYAYKGESTALTLPKDVKTVGSEAFMFRTKITSVALTPTVTKIESGAFSGCSSLQKVTFAGTVAQYHSIVVEEGNGAFTAVKPGCEKITVRFQVGDAYADVLLTLGSVPAVPASLSVDKEKDAYYEYLFSGWKMNGALYTDLPAVTADCTFTAEFAAKERVFNVQTLNDLLTALASENANVSSNDFCTDGVLNVEDLNKLLILLSKGN